MIREPVQVLLDRIRDFPEEFTSYDDRYHPIESRKWYGVISKYKPHFNKEELKAFETALSDAVMHHMKKDLVETLMAVPDVIEDDMLSKESLVEAVRKMQHEQDTKKLIVRQEMIDAIHKFKTEGKI